MPAARTGSTATIPAPSRLHQERDPGMIDEPLDQAVAHRGPRGPDAAYELGRVAQQADRAFGDHPGGRAIAGIAIAANDDAGLAAIGRESDEQQIVRAGFALLF